MKKFNQSKENFFPEEIMEQILLKLPTQSLLRFKSVGKQWISLISNTRFSLSHLKHVLPLQDQNVMVVSSDCSQFYLLSQDGNTLHHKYSLPFSPSLLSYVRLLGSCNGLLCLGIYSTFDSLFKNFDFENTIILWNPTLNDHKKLPFFLSNFISLFGFGYDSHTEDYKLVQVKPNEVEAEVYSLKSSSIRRVPFPPHCLNKKFGRFFNGSLYWISFNRAIGPEIIIFDLRYDKFMVFKFPTSYKVPNRGVNFTTVRDCDRPGVFFYDPLDKKYFKLVTMKDKEENGSISVVWSMIKIQHPEGNLCWPICYKMNDAILVRLNNDLFVYNPQRRTTKKIVIQGAEDWSEYTTFIQTLVLPSNLVTPSA